MALSKNLAAGALAGGLLLGSLTACSGNNGVGATDASASASGASASLGASASATETAAASGAAGAVTCSGASCSVTLHPDSTGVSVLGTTVKLGAVHDGTATIGVGDKQVSCKEGDSVHAGPLTLTCSTVTDQKVTLTASLG